MPKFQRCDESVAKLAKSILRKFESHQPLLDANVSFDFVFAYGDKDEDGNVVTHALKKNGVRALGIARKVPDKDRALGRADAEIALDGDWWGDASEEQQEALLDHGLHHVAVRTDRNGDLKLDGLDRPQIRLRKHDYEFGWFGIIAQRHKIASQECIQAKQMMDEAGQLFWPELGQGETKHARFRSIGQEIARP